MTWNRALFALACLCVMALLPPVAPAHAGPADAREVARQNNCAPKKIEVFEQKMGASAQTIYKVACVVPKTAAQGTAAQASALLIRCDGALCALLRTVGEP